MSSNLNAMPDLHWPGVLANRMSGWLGPARPLVQRRLRIGSASLALLLATAAPPGVDAADEWFMSTLSALPDRKVEKYFGLQCQFFFFDTVENFSSGFNGALQMLQQEGRKQGANGLLNMQLFHAGSQVKGRNGPASHVVLCGDLVLFE